jgi:hypothetical protein
MHAGSLLHNHADITTENLHNGIRIANGMHILTRFSYLQDMYGAL